MNKTRTKFAAIVVLSFVAMSLLSPLSSSALTSDRGLPPTVTCDLKAPVYFAQGTIVQVTGTVTDDGSIVTVEFTSGGAVWRNITTSFDPLTMKYSWPWDTTTETAGSHQVSIRVKDNENKMGSTALSVTIDGNDPDVLIKQPSVNEITLGLTDNIVISGDASDGTTSIKALNISLDAGNSWIDIYSSLKNKAWTYTWKTTKADTPTTHEIIVQATDAVGHTGNATVSIRLTDMQLPIITVTTPEENDEITDWTSPVQIKGTATDNVGVLSLEIAVTAKGQSVRKTNITNKLVADAWSWNWDAKGLMAGDFFIQVWAKDKKGNQATITVNITLVDKTFPTMTITAPVEGGSFTSGDTVFVMGKASDNVKLQKVELVIDGKPSTNITKEVATNGNFQHPITGLKTGAHQLKVKATDMSGNYKEASVTIKVNAKPSNVGNTAIIAGGVIAIVIVVILILVIGMKKGWIKKGGRPVPGTQSTATPPLEPAGTMPGPQPVQPGPPVQYPPQQPTYQAQTYQEPAAASGYTAPGPEPYVHEPFVDQGVPVPIPIDVDEEEAEPLVKPPPRVQKPVDDARPPVPGPPPKKGFQMPALAKNPQLAPEYCPSCGLDVDYEALVCTECGARLFKK